jgi:hypothetical protein
MEEKNEQKEKRSRSRSRSRSPAPSLTESRASGRSTRSTARADKEKEKGKDDDRRGDSADRAARHRGSREASPGRTPKATEHDLPLPLRMTALRASDDFDVDKLPEDVVGRVQRQCYCKTSIFKKPPPPTVKTTYF